MNNSEIKHIIGQQPAGVFPTAWNEAEDIPGIQKPTVGQRIVYAALGTGILTEATITHVSGDTVSLDNGEWDYRFSIQPA